MSDIELPDLPPPHRHGGTYESAPFTYYTAEQMRAYAIADREKRAQAAQPHAYAVYFPDQPCEELVHDLDELLDDMTNREHTVTPLFATEASKPVQACEHQFHYFGDQQKRRRCNLCSELEPVQAEAPNQQMDYERFVAIREGHFNVASEEYFGARPHLDTPENRRIFYAGHCKGYAIEQAEAPTASNTQAHAIELYDALVDALKAIIECDDEAKSAHGYPDANLNGYGLVDLFDCVGHHFGAGPHKQQPYRSNSLNAALHDARAALATQQEAPKTHKFYEWFGGGRSALPHCATCGKARNDPIHAEAPTASNERESCPHGNEFIVNDCLRCGAPVCCGRCCAEDPSNMAGEIAYQLTKQLVIDMPTARAAVDAALATQQEAQPQAEPMSEEKAYQGWKESTVCRGSLGGRLDAFMEGVRFTEKHHGIAARAAQEEPAGGDKEDAERYRWLREQIKRLDNNHWVVTRCGYWVHGDDLDADIRAARAAQQATGERDHG